MSSRLSSQASTTCAGVAPCRAATRASNAALLDGRIGHDGNTTRAAPRDGIGLDASPREIIEHLIGGNGAAEQRRQLLHVVGVEITYAPSLDRSVAQKGLKPGERLLQRIAPAPMQEIEIEAVGVETLQAPLAGGNGAGA